MNLQRLRDALGGTKLTMERWEALVALFEEVQSDEAERMALDEAWASVRGQFPAYANTLLTPEVLKHCIRTAAALYTGEKKLREHEPPYAACAMYGGTGLACMLLNGHSGPHEATVGRNKVARWPQAASPRASRGPDEGTWAVFAEKVVAERDVLRALLVEARRAIGVSFSSRSAVPGLAKRIDAALSAQEATDGD